MNVTRYFDPSSARRFSVSLLAGSAAAVVLSLSAQSNDAAAATKVKYAEVVRSVFYLPKYIAIANGYFAEQGIDVDMTTAWGGDKGTAMLLTGRVDIVLQGPETPIYVENSEIAGKNQDVRGYHRDRRSVFDVAQENDHETIQMEHDPQ